jgi:hypothetical protein
VLAGLSANGGADDVLWRRFMWYDGMGCMIFERIGFVIVTSRGKV